MLRKRTRPDMPDRIQGSYRDAINNMIFLKRQQWQIVYFILLAQAAVVGIATTQNGAIELHHMRYIAILVFVAHYVLMWKNASGMAKFRRRLKYIYESYYSQAEITAMELKVSVRQTRPDAWAIILQLVPSLLALWIAWVLIGADPIESSRPVISVPF